MELENTRRVDRTKQTEKNLTADADTSHQPGSPESHLRMALARRADPAHLAARVSDLRCGLAHEPVEDCDCLG